MKASEFYEKYWTVNGKPVPPLRKYEKDFIDNMLTFGMAGTHVKADENEEPLIRNLTIDECLDLQNKVPPK